MVAIDLRTGERSWEQDIGGTEAPWVAGEILSGPSTFRVEALFGAIAAAQAVSVVSPFAGALVAAAMYLAVRGPSVSESTIYES